MKRDLKIISLLPIYILILLGIVMMALVSNRTVETIAGSQRNGSRHTVVIDPGHGGEDGGATSCTGILESQFNLEIALKLNDMMHLLGINTVMIRETDKSVYTQGETISQRKISDLKERTRIINETENALLISIHQNTFPDGQYWGAQVFYPQTDGSQELAGLLQRQLQASLTPDNNRKIKQSHGVYLMDQIECAGVLLECGFLSNYKEEARLRDPEYQRNICAVIASTYSRYLSMLRS